ARVDPATLRKMEQAAAPFTEVDLVLVTHVHADHFSADSVAAFLANSSTATLVTSAQVADLLTQTLAYKSIENRIKPQNPSADEKIDVDLGGVKVDVLKLSHGGGRFAKISNLGYIVRIGGKRILHLGDAHLGAASMAPLTAHAQDVDVACVPYWWLLETKGQVFVRDTLKAKNVIAFHIPPAEVEEVTATIHAAMPDVTIFGTLSQSQLF
ncbi:MAG: MBL fold metallo-hydrolase, partial [Planctomycetes bacterium]|nr:MBL fold metallo-hydrolase [Planctomycetota bacterium]